MAVAVNSHGDIFARTFGDFTGIKGGVYRSTNNGTSWSHLGLEDVWHISIDKSDRIFVGTYTNGAHRSINNGASWDSLLIPDYDFSYWVSDFAISPSNIIYAACPAVVAKSENNGISWDSIGIGILAIYSSMTLNKFGYIFVGDNAGYVRRSLNNGLTWNEVELDSNKSLPVYAIASNSKGNVFAGTYGGGVYCSLDNGFSWIKITNEFPLLNVCSIVINSRDHIFVGNVGGGVIRSTNNGET